MPDHTREQLSAYLAGELDPAASAALEGRLAAEPWLAAELDRMADLWMELSGVDEVEPPEGYAERLRARLAAEGVLAFADPGAAASESHTVAQTPPGRSAPPGRRDTDRPAASRGQRSRTRWRMRPAAWAAAAALVVVAVTGTFLGTQQQSETTAGDASEDLAALDAESAELVEPTSRDATGALTEHEEAEAAAELFEESLPAPASPAPQGGDAATGGPAVVDEGVSVDADEVAEHLRDRPETAAVLGEPASEVPGLASRYARALGEELPFPGEPRDCLQVLLSEFADRVPVRAEWLHVDGEPRVAYVLVSASGDRLDTVEAFLVAPEDCTIRAFLTL